MRLTHPRSHTSDQIYDIVVRFKSKNESIFEEWVGIERKDRNIEIGELSGIQETVFKFLQLNADVDSHRALVDAWMDMRTEIRKRVLGLPTRDDILLRQPKSSV